MAMTHWPRLRAWWCRVRKHGKPMMQPVRAGVVRWYCQECKAFVGESRLPAKRAYRKQAVPVKAQKQQTQPTLRVLGDGSRFQ